MEAKGSLTNRDLVESMLEVVEKIDVWESVKAIFRALFNMRKGEESRSLLMFAYIFLLIFALMIIKPVSNSLFLSEFGVSQLPFVFILVAFFAAIVSIIYSRLLKTVKLGNLVKQSLQLSMLSLVLFWVFLFFNIFSSIVLYVLYVWVAIFAVISVSQFWILANVIFNLREAKRLFGFIGAGAILGGILGGYFANLFAPILGSVNLIFACIVCLYLCIPITNLLLRGKIAKKYRFALLKSSEQDVHERPLQLILKSRHLTFLASIIATSVIVAKLVDFQFSAIASHQITNEDELTAFFGFWLSNLNIVSMLIQLFLTRHVVGVYGVGTSLFFLPAGILFGAIAIFVSPSLVSAVFLKVCDGSLKNSVNKAGIELLGLPIPLEIKNQTKPFIDIFIDSFATGIGGLLLVLLTLVLNYSVRQISLCIILLLVFWIILVFKVRKEYIQNFRHQIIPKLSDKPEILGDLKNESVFGGLIRILQGNDTEQIVKVLKIVNQVQNNRLAPCFENLIDHPAGEVRLEVLRNLYYYKDFNFRDKVLKLVQDPDQEIKVSAIQYLFQNTKNNRIDFLNSYLTHQDYQIRIAALLCAARESRTNLLYQSHFNIQQTVEDLFKSLPQIKQENKSEFLKINLAHIIGVADIVELHAYLHILLKDHSPQVISAAVYNAGQTRNSEFIPIIISKMVDPDLVLVAREALLKIGHNVLEILVHYLNDQHEDKNVRLGVPGIIAAINTQKSANALMNNMDHPDFYIRNYIIIALAEMREKNHELKFDERRIVTRILNESRSYAANLAILQSLVQINLGANSGTENMQHNKLFETRVQLIRFLENRLDKHLERIFRLLELRYPNEKLYNVYMGLKSNKDDIRVNAVEFLDNVLTINLKKLIIPIVETTIVDGIIEKTLQQLGLKIPSEDESLITLLTDDDAEVLAVSLSLVAELEDEKYVPYVGSLIHNSDQTVKQNAEIVLKRMGII